MIVVRGGYRRSGLHYLARANHVAATGLVPGATAATLGRRPRLHLPLGGGVQTVARHTSAGAVARTAAN